MHHHQLSGSVVASKVVMSMLLDLPSTSFTTSFVKAYDFGRKAFASHCVHGVPSPPVGAAGSAFAARSGAVT